MEMKEKLLLDLRTQAEREFAEKLAKALFNTSISAIIKGNLGVDY